MNDRRVVCLELKLGRYRYMSRGAYRGTLPPPFTSVHRELGLDVTVDVCPEIGGSLPKRFELLCTLMHCNVLFTHGPCRRCT